MGILRRTLNTRAIRSSAAPLGSLFPFPVSDESLAPILSVSVSHPVARPGLRSVTLKPSRKLWEEAVPERLLPASLGTAAGTECLKRMPKIEELGTCKSS